ncbi:hypothetical protein H5410_002989 [Solanum commersonii]|uniref:Ubiquitin-like protease family profile domain-containing protein n=1 Tax=Solanum commersonii TaxID=4109 RepID=A0A9J6B3R8_SOLCO|nr:hypothetical protein H5410_002989 [Solanum commersonii]
MSDVPEYENKIVGTIKGFGIPGGLPWHLTDKVYIPINCNGEFHWVLAVVVLKERCIKFLSDGLQVPSDGISFETLCMRYASLLWNYGILKARSDYVSNNEDPQRPRPKKVKFDENVVVTTID